MQRDKKQFSIIAFAVSSEESAVRNKIDSIRIGWNAEIVSCIARYLNGFIGYLTKIIDNNGISLLSAFFLIID